MTAEALSLHGYTEVEVVGSGGLGDVYRARRASTGGYVAIKVVREHADREATERRVRRELDAMLRLKGHPNVVQVEELIGLPSGLALVMEFVAGGSLMDLLKRTGPFAPPVALAALADVTRALVDAHAVGIVHRDIKPHNVMVSQFGQCKVCDFGIAAVLKDSAYTDRTSALSYRYASPEELDEQPDIGPATDVYSLGVTLRHLLTGETRAGHDDDTGPLGLSAAQRMVRARQLELVRWMTEREQHQRPSAAAVLTVVHELEHALGSERVQSVLAAPAESPAADATVVRRPAPLPPPPTPSAMSPSSADVDSTVARPRRDANPPEAPRRLPSLGDAPERWWE